MESYPLSDLLAILKSTTSEMLQEFVSIDRADAAELRFWRDSFLEVLVHGNETPEVPVIAKSFAVSVSHFNFIVVVITSLQLSVCACFKERLRSHAMRFPINIIVSFAESPSGSVNAGCEPFAVNHFTTSTSAVVYKQ